MKRFYINGIEVSQKTYDYYLLENARQKLHRLAQGDSNFDDLNLNHEIVGY